MSVQIKEVKTKKEIKTFVKFPYRVFKDNPHWIPLLVRDELEIFNRKKNPAYESADSRLFLAYRGKELVGRIAAVLSFIANRKYGTRNLRFGWFDAFEDYEVAASLFGTVEDWGRELGMETLTGPHGFTDLDFEGMMIEGFDRTPTIASYYNPSYYPEFVERYGFEKDVDYFEFLTEVPHETGIPGKLLRLADRIKERSRFRVLKFKKKKELLNLAEELFSVLDEAFEEIYGTVPLTRKQVDYYIKKFFPFVHKDLIKVVVNDRGELAGFMITMPHLSRAFQKAKGRLFPWGWYHILKALRNFETLDFYLAGIRKKYRGQGVDLLMAVDIASTALDMGFKYCESNPELEENTKIQAQWKHFNPRRHRKRRIYKKNIL